MEYLAWVSEYNIENPNSSLILNILSILGWSVFRIKQSYRVFTVLVCFVLVLPYLVCFSHLLWFIGRSSCLGQSHTIHTHTHIVTHMNTHSFCCQFDKNKVDIFMLRLPFAAAAAAVAAGAASGGCPRLYFQCGMRHLACDLCAGKTNQ